MKKEVQNSTLFVQSGTAYQQQNQNPLRTNASFTIIKEIKITSQKDIILLERFQCFSLHAKSQTFSSSAPENAINQFIKFEKEKYMINLNLIPPPLSL